MGKLPFVVAPRANSRIETLGSEISGKIEIERKGYLTVGEKAFMANVNGQDVVLQQVMKLSRLVGKKYKLGQQEAYNQVVLAVTSPDECKYPVADHFGEEIGELGTAMLQSEQKKTFMMAYCMLMYRIDQDISMDDVMELHEDLVQALADLYVDEENKSTDRLVQDEKEEGEEEPAGDDISALEKK